MIMSLDLQSFLLSKDQMRFLAFHLKIGTFFQPVSGFIKEPEFSLLDSHKTGFAAPKACHVIPHFASNNDIIFSGESSVLP